MTDGHLGRREANKARTREAIVDAVHRLLATDGLDAMTAERVADEAGVSRRTFFNYFPSIDAVMAFRSREILDRVGAMLEARPTDEPLVDSLKVVIDELFTVDLLAEATTAWTAVESSPGAVRYDLAGNEQYMTELAERWVRARPATGADVPDPLQVEVTVAACMATFQAARRHWLARHTGGIDRRARDAFVATVHRAFEVLRTPGERADGMTPDRPVTTARRAH